MSRREKELNDDANFLLNSPDVKITVHRNVQKEVKALLGVDLTESIKEKIDSHEAEECSFVVCQVVDLDHPNYYPDNIITQCSVCNCDIQHRPYAPKKPPKLCVSCAANKVRAEKE